MRTCRGCSMTGVNDQAFAQSTVRFHEVVFLPGDRKPEKFRYDRMGSVSRLTQRTAALRTDDATPCPVPLTQPTAPRQDCHGMQITELPRRRLPCREERPSTSPPGAGRLNGGKANQTPLT